MPKTETERTRSPTKRSLCANHLNSPCAIARLTETYGPTSYTAYAHEIEITIFRIVQEALTNLHRYSGSPTAIICLARENEHIRAEIQDEGCGLQSPVAPADAFLLPGVGIAGMRERVELLNGTFEIESIPGRGTTVRAILPLTTLNLPLPTQTDPEISGSLRGFDR